MLREFDFAPRTMARDILSGIIVFLVALPLCLGIAIASDADPIAGLISGIVGGVVIGLLSGSGTSVSGPAAGLSAIVATQIATLGRYETFLLAVVLAGVVQIGFGLLKAGALSAFFPSSVIKGLLAAIGVILILKQFPLLLGHSKDMGMAFDQAEMLEDYEKHPHSAKDHAHHIGGILVSFVRACREIVAHDGGLQWGAITIGLTSVVFLYVWDHTKVLKKSLLPAPLLVVLGASIMGLVFANFGKQWQLSRTQMVDVPTAGSMAEFKSLLKFPDFSQLGNESVYLAAVTLAVVASLETLLNLDAVDKLDKRKRISPPNRELFAQGIGNIVAGLIGGIPITSVVIRGSVNVNAGGQTKLSAILHGVLLLACVVFIPQYLRMIPLSSLAAILLLTGIKLASPALFIQMWNEGRYQFIPFILTLLSIVLSDLLIGICIGLVLSLLFILNSNMRQPIRTIREKHVDGDVLHIELGNQVSFLNRASLEKALREAPEGGQILLDARRTDYIDPDVLSLIREFRDETAPAFKINMQLVGFREKYQFEDKIQAFDYSVREKRDKLTPDQVLQIIKAGNTRFIEGRSLDRDLRHHLRNGHKVDPMAVLITGIDSQTPVEMIFDLDLGDAFVIRTPGVVVGPRVIGGAEYAASVGAVKAIIVMAHADSSLFSFAVSHASTNQNKAEQAGCAHLEEVLDEIASDIAQYQAIKYTELPEKEQQEFMKEIARAQIKRSVNQLVEGSKAIRKLVNEGKLKIVGAIYDVDTRAVDFV